MRNLLFPAVLLFASLNTYAFERDRLERACVIEQSSLLKERNGTPSCEQLNRLNKQKSAKRNAQSARAEKSIKASKTKKTANGAGAGYRWNPNEGRYCQHDEKGFPSRCYY